MIRNVLVSLSLVAATFAAAQTQMPNAVKIGDEGITITSIPATAVVQFGTNTAPGIWAAPVSIPANALPLLASFGNGSTSSSLLLSPQGDPDPNVLKEIDAQQGPVAYDVGYTDANGVAQVRHVPALTQSSNPGSGTSTGSGTGTGTGIPTAPGTVVPLVISNVQPVTGSPAVPVLNLFAVKPYVLVAGVLSNFTWNLTINGVLFNCDFGQVAQDGTTTVQCIVPTPAN